MAERVVAVASKGRAPLLSRAGHREAMQPHPAGQTGLRWRLLQCSAAHCGSQWAPFRRFSPPREDVEAGPAPISRFDNRSAFLPAAELANSLWPL